MLARPMTPEAPDLSVVIPAYNEVENLDPLLAELRAALAQVSGTARNWATVTKLMDMLEES